MRADQVQSSLRLGSRIRLNIGTEIPVHGLGVYQSPPGVVTQEAVGIALKFGYRLIDTARIYGNEGDVGIEDLLVEKALSLSRKRGAKEIHVSTVPSYKNAISLHRKHGFTRQLLLLEKSPI